MREICEKSLSGERASCRIDRALVWLCSVTMVRQFVGVDLVEVGLTRLGEFD